MAKKTVRFLLPFLLGPAIVLGPAVYMQADAAEAKYSNSEIYSESRAEDTNAVTETATDLYEKASEAVSSVDKETVRDQIREALHQLDEMGISPTKIAENTFGVQSDPDRGDDIGTRLVEDARDTVERQSQSLFQSAWDKIMGDVSDLAGVIIQSVKNAVTGG